MNFILPLHSNKQKLSRNSTPVRISGVVYTINNKLRVKSIKTLEGVLPLNLYCDLTVL